MYSRQHRTSQSNSNDSEAPASNQFAPRPFVVQPQVADPTTQQNQTADLQAKEEKTKEVSDGFPDPSVFTRHIAPPKQPRIQMKLSIGKPPLIQRDKAEQTESLVGTLWAKDEKGNILPPSLEDISQGGVGDCFLFAAMAAIVNTNPQQIVSMIQDNGNGTYTVTFKGIGFFSSDKQTVSADFAVGKHGNVKGRNALWPLIIEKAYAQQKGGIDVLDKGGNPGNAVEDMLNEGPSRFDPRKESADYIMGKLAKAKEKKWPMTMLAPKKEDASKDKKEMADNTPGLHFYHAYTILDIDASKKQIKLFNPWGTDHPNGDGWIDIEQVRKFFIEVNING